jgi:hypothetical protein
MKLNIQIISATLGLLSLLSLLSCSDSKENTPEVVYFLVAETEVVHGDSYILPLTKPADIQQARQLIANQESKIVVAEISKGPADPYPVNRDLTHPRTWSWHVSEFIGFADIGIEILDGWPTYVEDHYDEWVAITKGPNGKGRIGFWSYTVVREIEPLELTEK